MLIKAGQVIKMPDPFQTSYDPDDTFYLTALKDFDTDQVLKESGLKWHRGVRGWLLKQGYVKDWDDHVEWRVS